MSLKSVGLFIRYKREALGYTRPSFYEQHHISSGYLANIEGGFNRPSSSMLARFAKILNVTPGLLLDLLSDEITYEQALVLDRNREVLLSAGGELTEGRFVTLPPHFTQEDHDFLMGIVNFIAATYEQGRTSSAPINITGRLKEPAPIILGQLGERMPDPWIQDNEKYLIEHVEELREWLASQEKEAG